MRTHSISCRAESHTHQTPEGRLEVRRLDGGATLAFCGRIGRNDAAMISRCLHTQLDTPPQVLVLDLSDAEPAAPELLDILRRIRRRARTQDVGLHVLGRGDLRTGMALRQHQRHGELHDRYDHIRRRSTAAVDHTLPRPRRRFPRQPSFAGSGVPDRPRTPSRSS
ncbi:MAG: hypothetical protein K0S40_774 [Actinomycetospora sp.]|jgi:hypothetical protein|nr:hypothetical protein [Actinomycetospora sp.]